GDPRYQEAAAREDAFVWQAAAGGGGCSAGCGGLGCGRGGRGRLRCWGGGRWVGDQRGATVATKSLRWVDSNAAIKAGGFHVYFLPDRVKLSPIIGRAIFRNA